MVHDLDLSMCLWEKACNTTVYILNKCPDRILKKKTPKEAFIGETPKVSHFHVFCCPMHIHILEDKKTKLEPSSVKGNFVGHNESLQGLHSLHSSMIEDK